jgi:hypothetical protein
MAQEDDGRLIVAGLTNAVTRREIAFCRFAALISELLSLGL